MGFVSSRSVLQIILSMVLFSLVQWLFYDSSHSLVSLLSIKSSVFLKK